MKRLTAICAAALLAVAAGCGGGEDPTAEVSVPSVPTDEATAEPTSEPATGATSDAAATAPAQGAQVLTGTVGEEGDPEAFVITLTDAEGNPVTELPAGEYEVQVSDPSTIHNFHLTGPGGVDESTGVPETTETTWTVTLEAGEYTFICDPHPQVMVGTFTVT